MMVEIRQTLEADLEPLGSLYRQAFPDEDLLPLVKALHAHEAADILSLVAADQGEVAGHVIFTLASVGDNPDVAALLGPLAVLPDRQRQGLGSALVRDGFKRLSKTGVCRVFVLGDPAYYRRFGFAADRDVQPPYSLPDEWREAWQSHDISDAKPSLSGRLELPVPWLQKELWAP